MSNSKEISQLSSFINVNDVTKNITITSETTPYVGIGTTNPTSKLTVFGDVLVSGVVTAASFVGEGVQGLQGTQGTQGLQGTQGTQGLQGTQGTQGLQGAIGTQGLQGTQGTQGLQGAIGTQGLQGAIGPSTEINATNTSDNTTYFPVFIAAADSNQTARVRTTATAFSFNASSSNLTIGGSLTASSLIPTGSTVPTNGVYLPDTNTLGFAANNNKRLTIDGTGRVIFEVPQQTNSSPITPIQFFGGLFVRNGTGANDTTLSIDITPTTALGPPPGAVILSAQSSPNTSGSRNLQLVADSSSIQLGDILGPTGDTKPIIFRTDGTERGRVDSSGRLLVGTSTADGSAKLQVDGDALVGSINGGPLAGFRNAIINGNFDIWQRGTSFTGSEYGADRWLSSRSGSTHTVTRQPFTLGQTDVPSEPTYYIETIVSSVAGANNNSTLNQRIEDVRTFAGQQVTLSFWAKADASKNIAVEFVQSFGTGGSPSAGVQGISVTKVALTTSWQKITVTTTIPSISGKTLGTDANSSLRLIIYFDAGSNFNSRTDSLGQQSGTFDIAQVQLESGPAATPFERRPQQTELALCQRYFQTMTAASLTCSTFKYMAGARTGSFGGGGAFNTQMRTTPSVTTAFNAFTNCTEGTHNVSSAGIGINADVTGAGNYRLTGGSITFDAEL
jgi:hypothetical protein